MESVIESEKSLACCLEKDKIKRLSQWGPVELRRYLYTAVDYTLCCPFPEASCFQFHPHLKWRHFRRHTKLLTISCRWHPKQNF